VKIWNFATAVNPMRSYTGSPASVACSVPNLRPLSQPARRAAVVMADPIPRRRWPSVQAGPRQSHSLAVHDRLQWPAGSADHFLLFSGRRRRTIRSWIFKVALHCTTQTPPTILVAYVDWPGCHSRPLIGRQAFVEMERLGSSSW